MTVQTFVLAMAALFALDVATTLYVLGRGGRELNPLLAWLIARLGPRTALLGTKAIALALLAFYAAEGAPLLRAALVGAYALLLLWNARAVLRAR